VLGHLLESGIVEDVTKYPGSGGDFAPQFDLHPIDVTIVPNLVLCAKLGCRT